MLKVSARKVIGYSFSRSFPLRSMSNLIDQKPVEATIRKKLNETFLPTHMDVMNESYMHNVPKGAETHFKVLVVSDKFVDVPLIKRHRMVMDLLSNELQNGVHALSIVAKTPNQWAEMDQNIKPSPNCRGGFGK